VPTIAPPWPPANPALALEWDHAGCCGPSDVCGRYKRVELRYDVIGERDAGPLGAGWLWIATGQLLIADATAWGWSTARSKGKVGAGLIDSFLDLFPTHNVTPKMGGLFTFVLDAAGVTSIEGASDTLPAYCSGQFSIPVTLATGMADPPDRMLFTPLRWYENAIYPYLG